MTGPTWTTLSDDESLRLVLLADPAGEHPAVERTRAAAASLAAARGVDVSDSVLDGGDPLRRLAGTVQLLDYASVYLGIAAGSTRWRSPRSRTCGTCAEHFG